jgi:hypothetical protein
MSRKMIAIALGAAALAISLVNPVLAQLPSTAPVDALLNAMRAKDAGTIRTLFAADASQQYGNGTPKTGDAFRAWIESDLIAAEPVIDDAVVTATAEGVIVTGMIRNNGGYANKANFLFTVDGTKIRHWQIGY